MEENHLQIEDETPKSLCEVSRQIRETIEYTSRLCYVAVINTDERHSQSSVGEALEQWKQDQKISGLCLYIGSFFTHLIESTSETLYQHLNWLKENSKDQTSMLRTVKLVAFTEWNPNRMYSFWEHKPLSTQSGGEEIEDKVDMVNFSWELYNNMCQIGPRVAQVLNNTKQPISNALPAALKSTSREILPTAEQLAQICTDQFMDLQEYITTFLEPIDIVLDNEIVWPAPSELRFQLDY